MPQTERAPRAHKPFDFVAAAVHLILFLLVASALLGYDGTQPFLGEKDSFAYLVHAESRFGSNLLGQPGAFLGAYLFNTFGLGALIVPLFFLTWAALRMSLRSIGVGRFFGFVLGLVSLAPAFAFSVSAGGDYSPAGGGGTFGKLVAEKVASTGFPPQGVSVCFGILAGMTLLVTLTSAIRAIAGIFEDYRMLEEKAKSSTDMRTIVERVRKDERREERKETVATPAVTPVQEQAKPVETPSVPAAIPLTDDDLDMAEDEELTDELREQLGKGLTFSFRPVVKKKPADGEES